MTIGLCIIGGTGYGAGELLRWCVGHPAIKVCSVVSTSQAGAHYHTAHPHLLGFYEGTFDREPRWDLLEQYDQRIVILALPHGESGAVASTIMTNPPIANVRVIDLSGDLRLKDLSQHRMYYGSAAIADAVREQAVYGLPEIHRDAIRTARIIANPGCLASTAILGLYPLTQSGLVCSVKIVAATGSSGAGKKLSETVHHSTQHANYFAYKVLAHQHEPEILQGCGMSNCAFVAHRTPLSRGIFVTSFIDLSDELSPQQIRALYMSAYGESPFVRLADSESPEVENVVGSNFCDIAISVRERTVVVMSATDNLVKGMAGTALQNVNIMCGLDETTGLWVPAVRPI